MTSLCLSVKIAFNVINRYEFILDFFSMRQLNFNSNRCVYLKIKYNRAINSAVIVTDDVSDDRSNLILIIVYNAKRR